MYSLVLFAPLTPDPFVPWYLDAVFKQKENTKKKKNKEKITKKKNRQ